MSFQVAGPEESIKNIESFTKSLPPKYESWPVAIITEMAKTKTRPYDAAMHLRNEKECALYLQAAIDEAEGDSSIIVAALGDIARARGMMQLANETGLSREGLYKALSPEGNPSFATVAKVIEALGLRLHASPVK